MSSTGVPDGNLGGVFAEIDRRLARYHIDNPGTRAVDSGNPAAHQRDPRLLSG
jgi:hypothetical protein